MRRLSKRFGEIIILIFVILVWCFSLYKVVSYVASLNFRIWGFAPNIEYFWNYPLPPKPPLPPAPPCPPPPCVTPTPTPTSGIPTPTPTIPSEVTPTPTSIPSPTPTPLPEVGGPPPGPGVPPVCGAAVSPAPTLLSVTPSGAGQVDLAWTVVSPVTHYSISYGLTSGNYIYGVSNTGNVTSFIVGGLDPAAIYCFAVRGVNDCAPSGLSNEICTGEVLGVGQVLGVTTLGPTGSFPETLFQILFIIGCVCVSAGLKLFLPAKRLA